MDTETQRPTAVVKYIPTAPVGSIQILKGLLKSDEMQARLKDAVAEHIKPEAMLKMLVMCAAKSPKLLKCSQESVIMSLLQAGQVGLDFTGNLGQSYMVPYQNQCTYQIGYRGFITLIANAGMCKSISADVIFEWDKYEITRGTSPGITHIPKRLSEMPDEAKIHDAVVAFYAVAQVGADRPQFDLMWRSEIDRIRDRSQGYQAFVKGYSKSTPWVTDYVEMGKKTVVKRLAKYLPMSIDKPEAQRLAKAIEIDDVGYEALGEDDEEEKAPPVTSGPTKMNEFGKKREDSFDKKAVIDKIAVCKTEDEITTATKGLSQDQFESVSEAIKKQRKLFDDEPQS